MGEMMPIATDVLVELKTVFKRLDNLTPVFEDTFKEFREVAKAARDVLPEFKRTSEDLRELTKAVKEELPGLRKTSEEFQTASRNVGKLSQRLDTLIAKNEEKITVALDRLQETLKKVSETLSDDNQKNLRETLANIRKASDRFDGIARNADDFFKDGKSAFKLLGDAAVRIDGLLINLDKSTRGFGERGPIIFKNLESGSDQLNKAMTDLRELLQYVARNEGTVQKLFTDPSLYNNLNDSAAMVTSHSSPARSRTARRGDFQRQNRPPPRVAWRQRRDSPLQRRQRTHAPLVADGAELSVSRFSVVSA